MKLLNVACGNRFHKDWTNIDFVASSSEVKAINILKGLPFSDNSFDVIYSSHFLEHLTQIQADFVLSEIFRVLKSGGIVRIVVPDLENVCKEYLSILSDIQENDNKKRYDWIILELLDQLVRTESGGEMLKIYKDNITVNDDFMKEYIFYRVGERLTLSTNSSPASHFKDKLNNLFEGNMKNKIIYAYISAIKKLLPSSINCSLVLNTSIGEKHLWMYDNYSLHQKIIKNGFIDVKFFSHNDSQIPKFSEYNLDTNVDGTPYKGVSSLYCEAIKP
jgi:predicted SAM-dependent methyltransferase